MELRITICLRSLVSTYCKRCWFVGSCAETCCMVGLWQWLGPTTFSLSLSHATFYQTLCLPTLCARHDYLSVCAIQDIHHNTVTSYPSWTILIITLCLHAVIVFPFYPLHQRSMPEDTLTLCAFASSGTNCPLVCWKLAVVLPFIMLL